MRNVQKGLDPDDFNGMTFHDLFNLLQLWYIEGPGDSEQRGIVAYGLGRAITELEQARPGDFLSYSTTPPGGHSVIFIDWLRDEQGRIVPRRYNFIHQAVVTYLGRPVVTFDTTQSVSENPTITFAVRATEPGPLKLDLPDIFAFDADETKAKTRRVPAATDSSPTIFNSPTCPTDSRCVPPHSSLE